MDSRRSIRYRPENRNFRIGLATSWSSSGLFTRFYGQTKLTPLVRTGNIAMMSDDKHQPETSESWKHIWWRDAQSGGLSGSPVFRAQHRKKCIKLRTENAAYMAGLGQSHLLGLVHRHWTGPFHSPPLNKRRQSIWG